jgi:hypothetical protein
VLALALLLVLLGRAVLLLLLLLLRRHWLAACWQSKIHRSSTKSEWHDAWVYTYVNQTCNSFRMSVIATCMSCGWLEEGGAVKVLLFLRFLLSSQLPNAGANTFDCTATAAVCFVFVCRTLFLSHRLQVTCRKALKDVLERSSFTVRCLLGPAAGASAAATGSGRAS